MSLFFNVCYFPFWLIIAIVITVIKYAFLNYLYKFILVRYPLLCLSLWSCCESFFLLEALISHQKFWLTILRQFSTTYFYISIDQGKFLMQGMFSCFKSLSCLEGWDLSIKRIIIFSQYCVSKLLVWQVPPNVYVVGQLLSFMDNPYL